MDRDTDILEEVLDRPGRRREAQAPGDEKACGRSRRHADPHVRVQSRRSPSPWRARDDARPVFARFAVKANRLPIAACLSLAALASAPAVHADGVVLEAAGGYSRGDVVLAGTAVTLARGERLVVLDRSGQLVRMDASGVYAAGDAKRATTISAVEAATGDTRRADLGGTRAEDEAACLARGDLTAEQCARARAEAEDLSPQLQIGLALRTASLKPGEPLLFKLESSFAANAVCGLAAESETPEYQPLALQEDGWSIRLMRKVVSLAPQRGGPRLRAPETSGEYRITCWAFATPAWDGLKAVAPAELSLPETVKLAGNFARVREEAAASASFLMRVEP